MAEVAMADLLSVYYRLFVNRGDIWFQQWIDKTGRCQYVCRKPGQSCYEPVTPRLIQSHLDGDLTVSWPALSEEGTSKWCCWDCDSDEGDLERIEALLHKWGFNPLRESKRFGRAGHLWLFFDAPVPAADLILVNCEVLAHARVGFGAVEFFPKSVAGLSQVRGPLGIHRKPGANNQRGWFEGPPKTVQEQLRWLARQPLNQAQAITRLAQRLKTNDELRIPRMSRMKTSNLTRQAFNILEIIPNKRRIGKEWATQCPACAAEGHDVSKDNLRVSMDGQKFCCVFGGPGRVHRAIDIKKAFYGWL